MKILSFDIETDGEDENITCAACAWYDKNNKVEVKYWHHAGYLPQAHYEDLVDFILAKMETGYIPLAHNGVGFDFRILGQKSGMVQECQFIANNSVDTMLEVHFRKGYPVALDAMLRAFGVTTKLHEVKLSDGTLLEDMSGAKAPELWAAGEHEAVLKYLRQDVVGPLEMADRIMAEGVIKWFSKRGKLMFFNVDGLSLVKDLWEIPEPDTSWASGLPKREEFFKWMYTK
jgi:hypothetical protein